MSTIRLNGVDVDVDEVRRALEEFDALPTEVHLTRFLGDTFVTIPLGLVREALEEALGSDTVLHIDARGKVFSGRRENGETVLSTSVGDLLEGVE